MATTKAKALIIKGVLGRFDTKPGRHGVKGAPGLKLHVPSVEQRYWTHRFPVAGRQTDLSLGPYPAVRFDQALKKYHDQRSQVTDGVDPIVDQHAPRRKGSGAACAVALTFAQEAERFIERKENEKGGKWTSDVHRRQWRVTLLKGPVTEILGPMPIDEIDTATVLKVLEPMWTKTQRPPHGSRSQREPSSAPSLLEASRSCPNLGSPTRSHPCAMCFPGRRAISRRRKARRRWLGS
jgi:hypothetical protein